MTAETQRYDHYATEKKWQKSWQEKDVFATNDDSDRPKYYILDMFPYPSGAGLHVGHVVGYTATDIIARHMRQKGFEVLHPMGWDSFGLPAEQYAIRTGTHPAVTTKKNIDTYRRQLQALGFSYDWNREFATSDPSYYKWTQWIFTLLYNRGLAYEAEQHVNFCPALGTVLANEEIENGRSKEGGHPVERRPLKQWVLKITAYAERLLADLDTVDWPDHIKKLQINWIGRSEGATVYFPIEGMTQTLEVFTTRPDTLFGATYMVVAPEHPLISALTTSSQSDAVQGYCRQASAKSELERTELAKDKSGVFTGAYALNPVSGERIPIGVSDYVLISYGSGAIMSVPAHDERDFAFAKQHSLPIRSVYRPSLEDIAAASPNEDAAVAQRQIFEGQRCWTGSGVACHSRRDDLLLDGMDDAAAKETVIAWLEKHRHGKRTVNYKLRDWLFARQRYWGEPFPILHLADGTKRLLAVDELPLCPPELEDYTPSGDAPSPLAREKAWVDIYDPVSGQLARRDINVMPQWAGSCWYYLRFCDPAYAEEAWSQRAVARWLPVDLYVGGVEHAVLHLLYARFWHKVLYDCGLVPTSEPFQRLRNQGMVLSRSYQLPNGLYVPEDEVVEENGSYRHKDSGTPLRSQIEKMSKSKLNGVTPDDIIEEFGADALRLYEMFMGPLDKEKIWNSNAVQGCKRFLNRFYDVVTSEKVREEPLATADKLTHRLVYGVEEDIRKLSFNTAIAKMMEFINEFVKLDWYPRPCLLMVCQALMPFAPHIAEEAWQLLGGEGLVSLASWPTVDATLIEDSVTTYVVQINGKLRGRLLLDKEVVRDDVEKEALALPVVRKHLNGLEVKKVIFVPDKLNNFVVA